MNKIFFTFFVFFFSSLQLQAQNFWEETETIHGGYVNYLYKNPSSGELWSIINGGLYHSTDNGGTWIMLNNDLFFSSVVSDLTGNQYAVSSGHGVYNSTDDGATWTQLTRTGLSDLNASVLAINTAGDIFLGSNSGSGCFRLLNGASAWTNTGVANQIYTIRIASDSTLYAGTYQGCFRSTNNGGTWENIGLQRVFAIAVDGNGTVFAAQTDSVVRRSTDNGTTWTDITGGLEGSIVKGFAFNGNTIIAGTSKGAFRSTNSGDGWQEINNGLEIKYINKILTANNGAIVAGTNGGGIFSSANNGTTWDEQNSTLGSANIFGITADATNNIWAGTSSGVFVSTNNGGSWGRKNSGLGGAIIDAFMFGNNGTMYAGSYAGGVFKSTDDGGAWIASGLSNLQVLGLAVNAEHRIFAATGSGCYSSTDNGTSWEIDTIGLSNTYVLTVTLDGQGRIYAGTNAGAFRSTNNGSSWTHVFERPGQFYYPVTSIVFRSSAIIVETNDSLFRSTDDGATWGKINNGFSGVMSVLALTSDGVLYAGSHDIIYRSHDGGDTWSNASSGFTKRYLNRMIVTPQGTLFASTQNAGIFRSTSEINGVNDYEQSQPLTYLLSQNYPNPFNPTTAINFKVSKEGFTTLKIFDALGQEVATVLSKNLTPGSYSATWNASGVQSGVYFYKLQSGSYSETKKLVLMK